MDLRPTKLVIDLDKLKNNIDVIRRDSGDAQIIGIVKSDAYGMGDLEITRELIANGITHVAVANVSEAYHLRTHFPNLKILILGYTPVSLVEFCMDHDITLTVYALDLAKAYNDIMNAAGKTLNIHVKLDTGMHRLGFDISEKGKDEVLEVSRMEGLHVTGIFSHFADSDGSDEITRGQYMRFIQFTDALKEQMDIGIRHISNSGAVIQYSEYHLDAIRPGIALYGSFDWSREIGDAFGLEFVASLVTEVASVKTLGPGEGISYGHKYVTERPTQVVVLPVGYSDGLLRSMTERFDVLIHGRRCPQIGLICMDQLMVDATGLDVKIGDEVVILGKQGDEEITLEELAEASGEPNTPFLSHLSPRLTRVYKKNGRVMRVVEEILEG
ncbi:alanine racemase [Peptoniphilus equinus]|uniref:Alanine racemase n=1 Tax=Peptoniphilus equinus TaxID=3016343 RepID=A0ABY7QXF3_9FIRM|nr:alanine racemase [Peptoniphilus equinus]WBW50623.1 alanine racemase [Peptoniphilus equinus]